MALLEDGPGPTRPGGVAATRCVGSGVARKALHYSKASPPTPGPASADPCAAVSGLAVIQGTFQRPVLFVSHRFADPGGDLEQLFVVDGTLHRQIQAKTAQSQCRGEPSGDGIG